MYILFQTYILQFLIYSYSLFVDLIHSSSGNSRMNSERGTIRTVCDELEFNSVRVISPKWWLPDHTDRSSTLHSSRFGAEWWLLDQTGRSSALHSSRFGAEWGPLDQTVRSSTLHSSRFGAEWWLLDQTARSSTLHLSAGKQILTFNHTFFLSVGIIAKVRINRIKKRRNEIKKLQAENERTSKFKQRSTVKDQRKRS